MLILSIPFLSIAGEKATDDNEFVQTTSKSTATTLIQSSMSERLDALTEINLNADNSLSKETIEQILLLAEKQRKDQEYTTSGEFGELYYSAIIDALGNTRDARAIPYLIDNLGSGTAVSRSLRKIGSAAIDPLIIKLHSDVVGYRERAAHALGMFLRPDDKQHLDNNEIREKIKKAFLEELKVSRNQNPDKSIDWYEIRSSELASVRKNILQGLGYLAEAGDNNVLFLIKSAAEKDPYYLDMSKKSNYSGPKKRYIVREEARKILDRLNNNELNK